MYTKLISEYRFDPSENPESAIFDLMHYGYVCIVDEHSRVLYSAGDCDDLVFYRSASKPIQSLPVFKYGLDKEFGIEEWESVVLSASHAAEPCHVQAVENILRKGGFSEDILCMSPTRPTNEAANEARIRAGLPLRKVYHNCSGKHAALLLVQKYLGGNVEDYWKVDTPVFREVADCIHTFAETDKMKVGVDGCGVPVFAVGMKNIAISFKNLACPEYIRDDALQRAAIDNVGRIQRHPEMIRGTGFPCTIMNMDPNIIAKGGANGVYGFGLKKQKLGVAFKLIDGTEAAWPFMLKEILRALDALTPEHEARLDSLHPTFFVNDNGKIVGERRSEIKISI